MLGSWKYPNTPEPLSLTDIPFFGSVCLQSCSISAQVRAYTGILKTQDTLLVHKNDSELAQLPVAVRRATRTSCGIHVHAVLCSRQGLSGAMTQDGLVLVSVGGTTCKLQQSSRQCGSMRFLFDQVHPSRRKLLAVI